MGIDKPNVRQVIHYGPADTIEAFYQQAGRAGRDGLPAKCLLFYSPTDLARKDYLAVRSGSSSGPLSSSSSSSQPSISDRLDRVTKMYVAGQLILVSSGSPRTDCPAPRIMAGECIA